MSIAELKPVAEPLGPVAAALRRVARIENFGSQQRDVIESIATALEAHAPDFLPVASAEPISGGEREALLSVGIDPDLDPAGRNPMIETQVSLAALAATALPLAEAADRLGVDPSRLRQRIGKGTLVGVRSSDGRSWRIPAFQFDGEAELYGLRPVLRAMRPGLGPLQAAGFFATPQPDLETGDDRVLSPVEWLREGHDPQAVVALARDL